MQRGGGGTSIRLGTPNGENTVCLQDIRHFGQASVFTSSCNFFPQEVYKIPKLREEERKKMERELGEWTVFLTRHKLVSLHFGLECGVAWSR